MEGTAAIQVVASDTALVVPVEDMAVDTVAIADMAAVQATALPLLPPTPQSPKSFLLPTLTPGTAVLDGLALVNWADGLALLRDTDTLEL